MARRGPGDADAAPVSTGEAAALAAILLVSAVLQLLRLDLQGIGNPYYAATVRSMLEGWHTFFFASFDPAGFVAVDKPPLGFWIQTLSARVLGYGGTALLLPQALATIGSVGLVWRLVRRPFGPAAGLFSALGLALTPIAVAAGRTNTIDPLLVLVLLAATGALFRAVERGDPRWLLLSAVLIGRGVNS
ncbi:MAG TPA: glycosyltransferase family 39 protein, partial [Thermomicrobiales bacterium]|nr:glycosyltransferase family 39 protein [Thermomicrobiales bacterium]